MHDSDPEPLRILHLYPRELNLYGDHGNVVTLVRRLAWHGFRSDVVEHHPGGEIPTDVDLIIGGGGQDSGQIAVHDDMRANRERLHALAADGVPVLAVCGLYQLLGHAFITVDGVTLDGIGLLDIDTRASGSRLTGTVVADSPFGTLVGFENHSGRTFLGGRAQALGTVTRGSGNNGGDGTEGARQGSVIGTYLHGPVLPNNPMLADHLISAAVQRRFGRFVPRLIDDSAAQRARAELTGEAGSTTASNAAKQPHPVLSIRR
ncbi:type 1 glutamine amidotransferase [Curtobacterium ammoniigenes]|uniref:type 1 glutamine amidotransferase n=1 Tax=Curtobacterium ammoniigenes TaxID=395387 RepID=UPI0009FA4991|nr:hypothetical protein [Curtobacterium ammoniigenes]